MDRNTIEVGQAETIRDGLFPAMNYMNRLRKRMEEVGFPPTDPLFLLVAKAFDALHALYNEMHYLSCRSGAGREPRA